jgi:hypothetical protein
MSQEEIEVSYVITLVFDGVGEAQYWAVNEQLGIGQDGSGDVPAGMLHHAAGPTAAGGWMVVEQWTSKEAQTSFMESRLGAALAAAGVPAPAAIFETTSVNEITVG